MSPDDPSASDDLAAIRLSLESTGDVTLFEKGVKMVDAKLDTGEDLVEETERFSESERAAIATLGCSPEDFEAAKAAVGLSDFAAVRRAFKQGR